MQMTGMHRIEQAEDRGRGRRGRRAVRCAISALVCVLVAPAAQAHALTTQTFTGGEQTFIVPPSVTSIKVLAIGEQGGREFPTAGAAGGLAAEVRGEVSVTPGQTLYVEVANGAGKGGAGFSNHGGGASDLRTSPLAAGLSPDTRLIVAGGGGGAGELDAAPNGDGGNAGEPGKNGPTVAGVRTPEGGGAGTLTHGGAGGLGVIGNGMAGTLGSGGSGGIGLSIPGSQEPEGGGGGGGYYGGGGGGGGESPPGPGAGGGGGGSSLVPAGGSMTVTAKQCGPVPLKKLPPCGLVQISYVPLVTKVEPTSGPAAGGTSVTITGAGFSGATAVKFGSTNATSFTVNSESSITAVVPPGTGTVDVTVTTSSGTSPTSAADHFTYGPAVTKVEPNHGSPSGGTAVTITGTGFTGASGVKFGSTNAATFTVNSATSITAVSPKGKGTVDVTVTTPAGTSPTSAADQFTFSRK
jgi:hypothetical protein